jgi:hypothetical protein
MTALLCIFRSNIDSLVREETFGESPISYHIPLCIYDLMTRGNTDGTGSDRMRRDSGDDGFCGPVSDMLRRAQKDQGRRPG